MNEIQTLFQMPDNLIHQLFRAIGCNIDYVPAHKWEAFTLGLQFVAALWFISWFIKFLYHMMKDMCRG